MFYSAWLLTIVLKPPPNNILNGRASKANVAPVSPANNPKTAPINPAANPITRAATPNQMGNVITRMRMIRIVED